MLFQKHNILPWEFDKLSPNRKAFLIASCELALEEDKKARDKLKKGS
ncbi:hypothetical protein [Clostridium phage A2]|nr:hypothetical protein CloPEP1_0041 [Clostridium phage Clo-PEP-1]ASZ76619.1 hypothetical protein [Clostridium phage CP3]AZF89417.1 XkdN [Clostridium phage CPD4]QGF20116.1 hypothetical protein CPAS15_0065 [Clostridium phage CPAS-15]WAB24110.1 hypothetical protein [Clostridium phage A2]WAB24187.1 hypothetical protein [Clostridium phage C2]WAB24264.1 hypothetical protein [Clostridium phage H1]WAB24341.1 hypothetical protein [Clostridium phage D1]WAB24418.1 hypothetical protein [Clostridium ph